MAVLVILHGLTQKFLQFSFTGMIGVAFSHHLAIIC
jgi:hypothetical protein